MDGLIFIERAKQSSYSNLDYTVIVDGEFCGKIKSGETIEIPCGFGSHTVAFIAGRDHAQIDIVIDEKNQSAQMLVVITNGKIMITGKEIYSVQAGKKKRKKNFVLVFISSFVVISLLGGIIFPANETGEAIIPSWYQNIMIIVPVILSILYGIKGDNKISKKKKGDFEDGVI